MSELIELCKLYDSHKKLKPLDDSHIHEKMQPLELIEFMSQSNFHQFQPKLNQTIFQTMILLPCNVTFPGKRLLEK